MGTCLGIIRKRRRYRAGGSKLALEDIVESREPADGGAPAPARDLATPPRIDAVVFARRHEVIGGFSPLSAMPRLIAAGVEAEGVLDWDVAGSLGRDEMQRQREFLRVRTAFSPWMTCSRCLERVQLRG